MLAKVGAAVDPYPARLRWPRSQTSMRLTDSPHPCPVCNRPAPAEGIATLRDGTLAMMHMCEGCTETLDLGDGERMPMPLAFTVDEDGQVHRSTIRWE